VLYVEYQTSFLHPLKYKSVLKTIGYPRLRKINERFFVYRPKMSLPFGYYSNYINKINQKYLLFQLRQIVQKLNITKPILWIFAPCSCEIVGKLDEEISVYHCIDSFKNEKAINLRRNTIETMERKLQKNCDIIFASSKNIFQEMKSACRNTFYIPSAVDVNFLEYKHREVIPPEMQHIPKPRIGFIGTVDNRLDLELIEYVVSSEPAWSFVIIGSIADERVTAQLKRHKNIYLLGFKKKEQIPYYIDHIDVCTIPYKINKFTQSISPVKIYEYLSLRKPIVSTQLPEVLSLSEKNIIKVAKGKPEFLKNIQAYLKEKLNPGVEQKMVTLASLNTWQKRTEAMSELIHNFLDKNRIPQR
jgi:hypothetical protein